MTEKITIERSAEEKHTGYTGAKFGMWFFLMTELIFFGGLFLLYSVYRSTYAADFHIAALDENIVIGSVNTVILITSSFTMALSISAIRNGNNRLSSWLQAGTIAMGCVFLVNKYFEWGDKISRGIYPDSPLMLQKKKGEILFYSLYYVMTGIHALHVIIGIVIIGTMFFLTRSGTINSGSFVKLENTGLYWHFV